MNVLYEGAVFEIMRCGGVARYFTELINRLPSDSQPKILGPEERPEGISHPNFTYEGVRTQPPLKLIRKAWRPLQQSRIGKLIDQQSADLVHWTYYSGLCKRPIRKSKAPTVVTLYDFIHEAYPDSDPSGKHHSTKVDAIEMADRICCISQATYDELCQRHPNAADRACITPLGSGLESVTPTALPSELTNRNFLLFVGRRDSYKNFQTLWKAWNQVKDQIPDTLLAIVGPPMKKREQADLSWNDQSDREILFAGADDALLKTLYQHCCAFVFPSKMEGFGLPVLEALSNNAPVIASTCAAFREIAGTSAYFFESDDVDHLSQLLLDAGTDSLADRETKSIEGHRQAKQFTWDNTAAKTVEVYRSLVA
ncbi:MAG: glycosyltransferase family 1 protein [Pirellulaceae bacterium]